MGKDRQQIISDRRQSVEFLEKIDTNSVIWFRHSFDTTYDRPSEDMGHFYDVIYFDKDKLMLVSGNPEDLEPIDNFLKRANETLIKAPGDNASTQAFFNKDLIKDLSIENNTLLYKEKYMIRLDGLENFDYPVNLPRKDI